MKRANKKYLIAIILIILTFGMVSCKGNQGGNGKKEVSDVGNKEATPSEDFFVWKRGDDNVIKGLTEEGKKQNSLVIPERCEELDVRFSDSEAVEVSFAGEKVVDLNKCFQGTESLENIELPKKLEIINAREFSVCNNLKSIRIPDTVTEVGAYAFLFLESLESVIFEDGTTTIGQSAFFRCPKLEEVILPEGLTTIGSDAFGECKSLKEIKLPASLKHVDALAFSNGGITDIYCPSDLELEFYHETAFLTSADARPAKVHVVEGSWADENFDEVFSDVYCEKVYYEE